MNEKETSRIEAFSDGVFAIALTLLAIDLKAPVIETINNANLTAAIVERWTEYFAFFNSFIVVLLMWISHHCIFKIVRKTNTLFILANGLVLFFVAAVSYPTSVLAKFLLTDAAPAAAAFYAGYLFMANGAFIMLLRVISGNKNLLMNKVYDDDIRKLSHGLFMALPIYLAATLFAFVNAWITVAITSLLWVYWVITLKNELL
ncbi:MAG: TMEM175 family protein [Candidatus Nitrotoga sp.]|nr:TMEM175 family protein [Candidatus Nitrotoga sp.]